MNIKKEYRNHKSYFFTSVAIVAWGSVATIVKLFLKNLSTMEFVCYMTFFASVALFLILYLQKKYLLLKKYSKHDYLTMGIFGVVGIFIYNTIYFKSFSFTSPVEITILTYSWPIFLVLLSTFFLKTKLTHAKIFSLLLGFLGVIVSFFGKNFTFLNYNHLFGNLLVLCSAFINAIFFFICKRYPYDSLIFMFIGYLSSFLISSVFLIFTQKIFLVPQHSLFALIYIGIVPSAIGFTLFSEALKIGDVSKIANLIYLTPIVSLIFISIFLREPMESTKLLGLALILGGIMLNRTPKTIPD